MGLQTATRARRGVVLVVAVVAFLCLHACGLGWWAAVSVAAGAVIIGLGSAAGLLARARRYGTTSLPLAKIASSVNRQGLLAAGEQVVYGAQLKIVDITVGGAPALAELLPTPTRFLAARLNSPDIVWLCVTDRHMMIWGLARQYVFDLGRLGEVTLLHDGVVLLGLLTPQDLKLWAKPLFAKPAQMVRELERAKFGRWHTLGVKQLDVLWSSDWSWERGSSAS